MNLLWVAVVDVGGSGWYGGSVVGGGDGGGDALIKAGAIAAVLYEVSNTLTKAAGTQAHADNDVKRPEFYDFNILPLDQGGVHQAIMQLPELADGVLDELMKKFFKNYTKWCKFLEKKNKIRTYEEMSLKTNATQMFILEA
ncbi:hypothetical protein R6Q59_035896 [Mikania micrantha]